MNQSMGIWGTSMAAPWAGWASPTEPWMTRDAPRPRAEVAHDEAPVIDADDMGRMFVFFFFLWIIWAYTWEIVG